MADPNSNVLRADQSPPPQPSNPSIQIPDPPSSILLQDDQSPHSTSSNPSPRLIPSPGGSLGQPLTAGHRLSPQAEDTRVIKGIRLRSGKWVSEIREPRKTTRVWLGTYPTPEMAAAAYDVAALALKGPDTPLNFPESIHSYPILASASSSDIRAAASSAASSRSPKPEAGPNPDQLDRPETEGTSSSTTAGIQSGQEFIDEEELLNLPNLLVDMAGGMLVSPPRINTPSSDDSPGNSDAESLWSYQ
ncbi:ETHYLENE-RESPONSIVE TRANSCRIPTION FACTOR ERF042-RELATED [Salix purpurea]|uniref:ETHYLENE-RESPONSIVE TRANSCRIPTION FACTOR ERF042-RELATED n=1 Tax=Salix purpurea TaxID=77065 RepID=A0A9Q0ZV46_SALPP|nr:ETHYLENE-RESPONSIVE TRANSCRIPTION FACTOR ERF042-RELATED [Salix purpurea]